MVDVSSVFNPGGIQFGNKILLLLRVQNRGRETLTVKATPTSGNDALDPTNATEATVPPGGTMSGPPGAGASATNPYGINTG